MKFIPENLGSKLVTAFSILFFVLSVPSKSFIWHLPTVDYVEIASGESRVSQNRNLECASSSNQPFGGRIIFQNSSGNDVGFIPFTIKPFGLLKKSLKFSSFSDHYGSFRLEVDYRHKRSLNCYMTLEPEHILLPFDQVKTDDSFITLGAESQNRKAKEVNISIANLSKEYSISLSAYFYAKDGTELIESKIDFPQISAKGRLIYNLPNDILSKAGLIKIKGSDTKVPYSAYILANGLDEEQYEPYFVASAAIGSCSNKKFLLNHDNNEEPLLEIANVSDIQTRAFLSLYAPGNHKIFEESVLIPPKAIYPLRVENGAYLNLSCDQGALVASNSSENDNSYTLSTKNSYTSISLPVIKKQGIKNIIKLNSNDIATIEINLYSITGEKLFTPFEEVQFQGNLSIPLDQQLGPKFEAVAVIKSKKSSSELVSIALIRKEDSNELSDAILKFPETLLTAKEEKPIEKLEQEPRKNFEIPDNIVARREKDLLTLVNDKDFESHCVKRNRSAVPDGIIKNDSLEFDLNLRKLLKHGVSEVRTFQINNYDNLVNYLNNNNYFLPDSIKVVNNKSLIKDNICLSLVYANENFSEHVKEIPAMSFDFRKTLLKGSLEKKIRLDGAAWLKAIPDTYLFCFRTTGDCEIEKSIPNQYVRSFTSPNKISSVKASSYLPLLTIDRPYKPKNSNKSFKIKAYMHEKVPYEILATVNGIKSKNPNENVNCKDLNGKYRLQFTGNKWVSSRQNWDRTQKLDLSLSYNPITFVHSQVASQGPEVADNCSKFFDECNIGMWSINVANGLSNGAEPHGWGRFIQEDKYAYRWNALPLLDDREISFDIFELSKSKDQPNCDYKNAKIKLKASDELTTLPEVIAKREAINKYLLPRKIFHPDTYPLNQPAPGIPYAVDSNLNPYVSGEDRMTLSRSADMVGKFWLDEIK